MNDVLAQLLRDPRLAGDLDPITALLKRPAFAGAPVAGMDPRYLDPTGQPMAQGHYGMAGAVNDGAPAMPAPASHGARGPGLAQRFGPLNVPFLPEPEQFMSPGRILLRSLVAGYNSRAAASKSREVAQLAQAKFDETRRYHDIQAGNMGHDNTNADQRLAALEKQQEWARANGDERTAAYLQGLTDMIRHRGVTEAQTNAGQAETRRYHGVLSGQAATREKRIAAGGDKGGGGKGSPGSNDISSPVSQYFRNIGEQLKAGGADTESTDAWVAKQVQTAQMNEVTRRGGTSAPNAPQGEVKPSENPNLTPEQRAYWKARGR